MVETRTHPGAASAIRLKNATVAFAEKRLVFDCEIPQGISVAVAGPSGAGKSTLFNVIAGFQRLQSGSVEILGENMQGRGPAERPVSLVFQDNNLFSHLAVAENVGLGINPALKLTGAERQRIADALTRVGLGNYAQRMPSSLSGGERQRVALARAFVRQRPIILLDEPFASLDPAMRAEMTSLLVELKRETKSTILMITHQPDDIRRIADRAMFIEDGAIRVFEPVADFFSHRDNASLLKFLAY
ncbi:thiamine ABC transporter ATP-binding protein [Sinorhizobium sp. BG8]|uniref:thiamine ABC transporter ATP-binding protein n=1 Tax=Sinorhizobium sp. BG8 TaxID=2613773 RepID=UPI00193D31B0|nr:thiamine ABC transporter ATP-binding protein [Sinorhizobium sp. BG8]QRM53501.1 thiamine ABC transporter ATP-binding protein [Sinorhizobium sp. BG8]